MMNYRVVILMLAILVTVVFSEEKSVTSTSGSRKSVEVTVYNGNFGFVKEIREIKVPSGENELQVADVAALINPVTVYAKSTNYPDDFLILEQNYEYDLISHQKLMEKYVGKKIKIIDQNEYKDRKDVVEAQLLSVNNGEVYKIDEQIYLGHPGIKVLPEIPDNLVEKPTLIWKIKTKKSQKHKIEISYLTNGITWNADYVLVCSNKDNKGSLNGWVTIENRCGAAFSDATLKLVAGNVNKIEKPARMMLSKRAEAAYDNSYSPQFAEESIHEYHMYDLQRKTVLKDNQTKQISLLESGTLKIDKEYLVEGESYGITQRYSKRDYKVPVQVYLNFRNSKENGLKMPLPAGNVRIFTADSKGRQQFIGEDHIDHTPENGMVQLKSGEAFDIIAEKKQTSFKQISTQLWESEWKVELKNHKNDAVTVGVVQPMMGNWEIVKSNYDYEKIDAFKVMFKIPVKKQGEAELSYQIKVGL